MDVPSYYQTDPESRPIRITCKLCGREIDPESDDVERDGDFILCPCGNQIRD